MSDTCIVCLGDLNGGTSHLESPRSSTPSKAESDGGSKSPIGSPIALNSDGTSKPTLKLSRRTTPLELIAHLLPCGHDLHDDCLKPWVERANSCPICRRDFHLVELSEIVGGPVVSSYPVEARKQVADFDPTLWVEGDDEDEVEELLASEPCQICGEECDEHVLLMCDGCDLSYHTYCVDLEDVPQGRWYCATCQTQVAIEATTARPLRRDSIRRSQNARTVGHERYSLRSRQRFAHDPWAHVWQHVWDNLNMDLDDPDEDTVSGEYRRAQRQMDRVQRETRQWQRRFRVAQRQGAGDRFEQTAPLLDIRTAARDKPKETTPETREEKAAWHDFEKAKELASRASSRKRKRPTSKTPSPIERTPMQEPERKLKRPRTRPIIGSNPEAGPSNGTNSPTPRRGPTPIAAPRPNSSRLSNTADGHQPSFLQSLLRDVEEATTKPQDQPANSHTITSYDHTSPPALSSPGASPTGSNHPSPYVVSTTPPPYATSASRPNSPIPLTSKVEPVYAPPKFSPSRSPKPPATTTTATHTTTDRSRRLSRPTQTNDGHDSKASSPTTHRRPSRAKEISPSRLTVPLSTKEEIMKIVNGALQPYWAAKPRKISKEEFTRVNRDVSRMLYERVDVGQELRRDEWVPVAETEVEKMVQRIRREEGEKLLGGVIGEG
ncbi:MAG: PHD and RING finger domain-containing protein 1 [Vezdaea acicularis]|nr:MAG: PHD and RING finger domain-containing protein 1 [Vezdaea acicularis]